MAGLGAVLALDVGAARIGVAVSESRVIPTTLPAIMVRGKRPTLDAIEALVSQHKVSTIVIGLPLLEGGAEGSQAEATRAFARSLSRRIPTVVVEFWDERYSSAEASDILGRGPQAAGRVDSVAAAVILQEYLDHQSKVRQKGSSDAMQEPGREEI